jgi:diguanylate cyclase (GGDEF)-like protein
VPVEAPLLDAAAVTWFHDGPIAALTFDAAPPHRVHDATPSLWRLRGDATPLQRPRLDELLPADDIRGLLGDAAATRRVSLQRAGGGSRPCIAQQRITADGAHHHLRLVDADWLAQAGWQPADDGARLQQALARTRAAQRFLQVLQHVTELLQGCDGVEQAGRVVADGGRELFPGWDGALTQADAGGAMRVIGAWGETPVAGAGSREDECWALRLRRLHRAGGAQRAPVCRHWGAGGLSPGITQTLCVPLAAAPEPAVLHLATRRVLDGAELRTACWGAEALAGALGLALANLRLRHSLREQALRDGLTGLFNRRHFDDTLRHEISRAERTREPLTLALLDIDHFKACNDRHGHAAGDAVLRAVAAQLQGFGRSYDVACRVGGEEFAVLMPRAHIGEARARLEQLRERIAAQPLRHGGVALRAVTMSIGVAGLDQGPGGELLQRADVALYAAKGGGRNRVAVWDGEDSSLRPSPRGRGEGESR